MSWTRGGLGSGLVLVWAASGFVMATTYVPTDLGDLPGGDDESRSYGINANGQVVGYAYVGTNQRGFLWSNGVMTDLGDLSGEGDWSRAEGVNASGQVVGATNVGQMTRAFLWTNGVMTDLGDLTTLGTGWTNARALNDNGQVVGYSLTDTGDSHPFLWANGVMTDLGDLPGAATGGHGFASACAINDSGQVVGYSELPAGNRAFLWENGTMTALAALPGGDGTSEAYGINASGKIVGFCASATGDRPVLWQNGAVTDLGDLSGGGEEGWAYGINVAGQVVGRSDAVGFVWDPANGMRDLNDMLPGSEADDWEIWEARGINAAGQIAGRGQVPSGQAHAVLLTPVEAPVIATIADGTCQTGQAYTVTPTLAGGDPADKWELISGPSGLTVDPNTGAVSWATPTSTGSPFTITIRATNVDGSDDETWELTVTGAPGAGCCASAAPLMALPLVCGLLLLRRIGGRRRR